MCDITHTSIIYSYYALNRIWFPSDGGVEIYRFMHYTLYFLLFQLVHRMATEWATGVPFPEVAGIFVFPSYPVDTGDKAVGT
jgi:hypothetical protein